MNFIDLYNQTKSNMFLIGECHGTKEMPQTFIKILKEALTLNKNINVFLEFPVEMQKLLNDYIEGKASYKDFLKTTFFNPPKDLYDGRLSKDMFKIIDFIKDNKNRINSFFTVGRKDEDILTYDEHELSMCKNIYEHYDKDKLNFYYVGSAHAITQEDKNDWFTKYYKENNYLPCGIHLKENIPSVISINLEYVKGKYLSAFGNAYSQTSPRVMYVKYKNNVKREYNKFIKENNTGHDYHYYIKRVTPSYKLR